MLIFRTTNRGYTSKIYGDGITARSVKADDIVLLTDYQGNITVKIAYYDINDNFLGLYNFTNLAPGSVYGAYTMSHDASYIAYLHTIPSAVIANRGLLKFSFQFIDANGVIKNTPIFTENITDSVYTIDSDAQPTIVLDNRYWPIADTNQVGLVKVDGTTILADADGTIHMVDIDKLEGDINALNANLLYPTITNPTLSGEVNASAATVNGGILKAVELKGTIQADESEINNITLNEANINNATLLGNLVGNNSHIEGFSFDGTIDAATTVPTMGIAANSVATKGYVDVVSNAVESHIANTNNPHETTGANAKIEKSSAQTIKDYVDNGLTNTLQQAKAYSDTKQSSKTSFVYETLDNFLENIKYSISGNIATLTKIIDEYGTEYPSNELQIGSVNVYLRQQDVPDYWLSKKQVEIVDVFSPLDFFLPLEAEMDVDLMNYVKYSDYATSTKGGVVKVSTENGVKVDSNGQLSVNPATAEEIQSGTGNKVITSSNLPNASRENKGVVKLSSSFEINENGNLDIPIIDIGTLSDKTSYSDLHSKNLTDEQVAKIRNSDNIILKFNEASVSTYYRHVNMTRTGETYDAGELYSIQFASTSLSSLNNDGGVFIADLNISSKQLKYLKIRLWSDFTSAGNLLYLFYKTGISSANQKQVSFATINNQSIVGTSYNIETSIKLSNTTVSTWESDTTYADYPYKATITAKGVKSSMVAEVVYDMADAESGNYASVCNTFDGGVYIYSKVNTAITIPTILVVK